MSNIIANGNFTENLFNGVKNIMKFSDWVEKNYGNVVLKKFWKECEESRKKSEESYQAECDARYPFGVSYGQGGYTYAFDDIKKSDYLQFNEECFSEWIKNQEV